MKRILGVMLILISFAGVAEARSKIDDAPEWYAFDYEIKNNKIIEESVCDRYGGSDWKKCRRHAQHKFSKKCWDLGYELKHMTGKIKRQTMKEREFFCDAKSRVTPLK